MIRKNIRHFLNKRNYDIVKKPYMGDLYPNLSKIQTEYYCETPTGKWYLPYNVEKDPVTNVIARGGYFEPDVIGIAKQYIAKNSTVLDIGSNFGQMSVEFSRLVGAKGKVYSFEAQEVVHNFTVKNLAANNCDNVILINKAVYNENGKVFFFEDIDFENGNPYSSNYIKQSKEDTSKPVESITIDSLNIADPISLIKIDIQGSDLFGLQGAKETILKNKPIILFEFEEQFQEKFGTSFQDYVDFVNSIGYRFLKTVMSINYLIGPKL